MIISIVLKGLAVSFFQKVQTFFHRTLAICVILVYNVNWSRVGKKNAKMTKKQFTGNFLEEKYGQNSVAARKKS